jgi:ATP-binding cassette subfamily B protein
VLLTIPAFAFEVFHPIVYALIIDEGILHHHTEVIPRLTALLIGLILVQGAGSLLRERMFARLGYRVMGDLRYRTFAHLQRLSLDFYARSSAAEVSARVSGTLDEVEEAITETFPQMVARCYTLTAWIALLFYLEWRIGILCLIVLPAAWLGPRFLGPRVERATEEQREQAGQVAGTLQENIANQPVVKAFGLHHQALGRLRQQLQHLTHSAVRTRSTNGVLETLTELGGSTYFVAAIAVGAWLASDGHTSVGALVASLDLLVYIVPNIRTLFSGALPPMQQGAHALQELDELLGEAPQVVDGPDAHALLGTVHTVRLEDVTFSYTGEQVNLDNVSLDVSRGRFLGVSGTSGSGKSTIVSLLLRFYDPVLGSVRFDGEDLRRLTQESVRAQTGAVFQETVLFNTTIRENIRVGRLDAGDDDVESAARQAEIHEFVMSLPHKYDTLIGDRGHRLSGGQRQRIALARALLRNPAILLLDEATSSLDAETENAVMATLRQAAAGRIVIAVTHRLAAVKEADGIVVLDRGRIVEQGTHDELLTAGGLYARLWQQQGMATAATGDLGADAIVERLRSVAMFRSLDAAALTALAGRVATERFESGEVVFSQGDPADKLYLLVQGRVEVVSTAATGEERVTAVLGPGDTFGEMALRRDEPRATTVRVRAAAQVLSLERAQILKSTADVLDLPDAERGLVTWLMRHGDATPAEAAAGTGQQEEAARAMLDALVARGYVQEIERDGELRFRARLAPKRARELPKNIWRVLGDRLSA